MNVKVKLLNDKAKMPFKGSEEAAGFDLCACLNEECNSSPYFEDKINKLHIFPHKTEKIHTGIAIEIPKGYFGGIYARSGLATKYGLRPANCVGVIDSDYRGEIIVALHNDTDTIKTITDGERIAQLVVQPYLNCSFTSVENLDKTKRGNGGFGSTGK